jgi:hypothetical protein
MLQPFLLLTFMAATPSQSMPDFKIQWQEYGSRAVGFVSEAATTERVQISNAGHLEYAPGEGDLPAALAPRPYRAENELELGITSGGKIVSCQLTDRYLQMGELLKIICDSIRARGKFVFKPNYKLDVPIGYYKIRAHWRGRHFISQPVELLSANLGKQISVVVTRRGGKLDNCKPVSPEIGPEDHEAVCAALKSSATFARALSKFNVPKSKYTVANNLLVQAWVAEPAKQPASQSLFSWEPAN